MRIEDANAANYANLRITTSPPPSPRRRGKRTTAPSPLRGEGWGEGEISIIRVIRMKFAY